ncbi:feruloyl esterase-like protein (alcohol dehydrogenase) [Colletotrichum truncatum]|uniref:Feruloyl esterase-like protein (Alcohol dehydrogenase) n=1 Tax=Colletotrichum truncatum TaxID=5467 RepID=A0ACC3YQE1_COLTU|nr:feruloyl esterase-like protein (alcohol dehydrogenase) [Colletotrichum truncatum]KAF6796648.1 feruloyl esterase-like protein (alcohol dehydrogenase) [Colletotrichum truncatum]
MSSTTTPTTQAPLSETLTLIVTTSPTPSAPLTDLLDAVFQSFRLHCPDLLSCRIIVVFDTYERVGEVARLKKGQVTEEGAKQFAVYKDNVKKLVLDAHGDVANDEELIQEQGEAEYGYDGRATNIASFTVSRTSNGKVAFVEPAERLGFGLAVRTALRITTTPYVWVHQHDWRLVADIPIAPILDVMKDADEDAEAPVKYVCLASVRMLEYANSAHVQDFPNLRTLTTTLKRDFASPGYSNTKVPLTPLFFWHDKPHIVSTQHYLSRVFPTRLAIPRGAFIEDTIGHRARTQMKEQGMWARWACWLFYPDEGKLLCLRHLDGRRFRGVEAEEKLRASYREGRPAKESNSD